ncbi:MAG: hypothetical protein ACTSR8_18285 [Promethearchaeota archaeon]
MESLTPFENIVRMKQIFLVGGNGYEHPSDFARIVNKNLKILRESDNNAKVIDIKFNVYNDPRWVEHGPTMLAFITAEVDVDITPKVEEDGITRKKKKRKRRKGDN